MLTFNGTDAYRAVLDFWGQNAATLPESARVAMLDALAGSDMLGTIIGAMEALYAARADLGTPGIELLDGLARFVGAHNFYGKGTRAALMAGVTARIIAGGDAVAEGDPEIDAALLPKPEPVAEADPSPAMLLAAAPMPADEGAGA